MHTYISALSLRENVFSSLRTIYVGRFIGRYVGIYMHKYIRVLGFYLERKRF
jgi:hypothetical protein